MIYPFSITTAPIIRYPSLSDYEIGALVSPKSWGYVGKDAGFCDGGAKTNIIVIDDFELGLSYSDTVFMNYDSELIQRDVYAEKIKKVLNIGKKLIINYRLKAYLSDLLLDWSQILVIGKNTAIMTSDYGQGILPINVPTIIVAGTGENCDKFNIQLGLREYFTPKSSSILQFGTKDYSELFRFMPLPDFLFVPGDFSSKILSFNHYLYHEVKKIKPDLLIIGVPGGISYITLNEPRKFGELALCISNAVNVDVGILSMYADKYPPELLEEIRKSTRYKLKCPIVLLHVSNKKFIFDVFVNNEPVSFLTIDAQRHEKTDGTFFIHDKTKAETVYSDIEKMFTESEHII